MENTFEQNKGWVYRAVVLLSLNGGFVNAMTFESFFHNPVGYVTGNITFAAAWISDLEIIKFIDVIGAIGAFLLGAIISGLIVPHNNFIRNRNYNTIFTIEAILILVGMLGLIFGIPTSKYLLAIALGIQNGGTTYYGKSIIRTTHMTGTTTDLGILIAHKLIKHYNIPIWQLLIRMYLLLGFFIGSILGILFYKLFGYYGLLFSICCCLIMIQIHTTKHL